jgi:uncharacterized membrane protein YiaA
MVTLIMTGESPVAAVSASWNQQFGINTLVYLIGIWRTCPLFSGKGYFLGVLVMGMFAVLTWPW